MACAWASSNCGNGAILSLVNELPPSPPNLYSGLWAEGDVAYVASSTDGVDLIDISNPLAPSVISRYAPEPGNPGAAFPGVFAQDGLLFIPIFLSSNGRSLEIVDVRDPSAPVHLVDVFFPGSPFAIAATYHDNFLYMTFFGLNEIAIYDLSLLDPDNPPLMDITDPLWRLTEVSTPPQGSPTVNGVNIFGGRLYVGTGADGFAVYDITNVAIEAPEFLGKGPGNNVENAWPTGNEDFVVASERSQDGAIKLFRMSENGVGGLDFTLTDEVTLSNTGNGSSQVVIDDGYRVYCAWSGAGLRIYDVYPTMEKFAFLANFATDSSSILQVYPFSGPDNILTRDTNRGLVTLSLDESERLLDLNIVSA